MRTIKRSEDDWLQKFQDELLKKDCSPVTIRGYINDLRLFLRWLKNTKGNQAGFEDVMVLDLIDYRRHLINEQRFQGSTINRRIQSLRKFFQWARDKGLLEADVSAEIRFVKIGKRLQPARLQRKEVNAMLRAAKNSKGSLAKRNFALLQLMLQTGLRVGETAHLCLSDVIILERSGSVRVREGKGLKERDVPVNASARKALSEYLSSRDSPSPNSPLFQSERGGPLSIRSIQSFILYLARKAEITRIQVSAHTLRHTFAMNYLEANPGKLVELSSLLGHESLDTTAIYTRPSKEQLAEDLERISSNENE